MTNAIEQAKREMYKLLEEAKEQLQIAFKVTSFPVMDEFESALESYLEITRQDREALHETAPARFEDIGKLWEANADLVQRLAKMTEERDAIQLRLHAVDHAYKTQQEQAGTSGQDSVDRASCEAAEANAEVILAAVRSVQLVITDWGMGDLKAKKAMRQIARIVNGDGTVADACGSLEKDRYKLDEKSLKMRAMLDAVDQHKRGTCMHSFFAIDQDQMKCTFCGVGK